MIENFFTEEKRIHRIVNEAVEETKANEIIHLTELNIPKEKIIEFTGFSPEFADEVLSSKTNS